MNVLVLCTGNSCRSQMAHGYLQQIFGEHAKVYSAGVEAHGVNPKSIIVMQEDGVDISTHTSNVMEDYTEIPFEYVITVCDNAKERCPVYLGAAERIHQTFKDPHNAEGTEEEVLDVYREVRNNIKDFCIQWASEL